MIKHMITAAAIVAFSAPAFADRTTSAQQAAATPDSTSLPQQQANGATTPDTMAANQGAVTPTPSTADAGKANGAAPDAAQPATTDQKTASNTGTAHRNNDSSTAIDQRNSAFSGR